MNTHTTHEQTCTDTHTHSCSFSRQQYRRETFLLLTKNPHNSMKELFYCLVQLQLLQERGMATTAICCQSFCDEHKKCVTCSTAVNWREGVQLMTEITAGLPSVQAGSMSSSTLVVAVTDLLSVCVCVCVSVCVCLCVHVLTVSMFYRMLASLMTPH